MSLLHLRLSSVFALSLLALSGCGDENGRGDGNPDIDAGTQDGGEDAGNDAADTDDSLVDLWLAAECERLESCPGSGRGVVDIVMGEKLRAFCEGELAGTEPALEEVLAYYAEIEASLDAGRTVVDETEFLACIAAAADCYPMGSGPCMWLFEGTVADGQACSDDRECALANCETASDSCGGTCVEDTSPLTFVFTDVAADQPCGGSFTLGEEGTVIEYHVCPTGLVCVDPEGGDVTGSCETPGALGGACIAVDCANGLVCIEGTCRAIEIAAPNGECDAAVIEGVYSDNDTLKACNVADGYDCVEGECVAFADGQSGSNCIDDFQCDEGLYCLEGDDLSDQTCEDKLAIEDTCDEDDNCLSGICDEQLDECISACP